MRYMDNKIFMRVKKMTKFKNKLLKVGIIYKLFSFFQLAFDDNDNGK